MTDDDLFATIRERLFTAVIGDVMDKAGLTRQFLPAALRAIVPGTMIVGRAMPVQVADAGAPGTTGEPYGLTFRALDDLRPGEVYVAAGGTPDYALWGGLMATRAARLGAVGAVLGGCHRDTPEIVRLGFPVFSLGAFAQDQKDRGEATDFRCRIRFDNGTAVAPGDVIVGDVDGVLVIPAESAADIVRDALAKVTGEDHVRSAIEAGESTDAVFRRTGIM